MSVKLKKGFFRVTVLNPYVPLSGQYYGYEADNVFQIRKTGGNVVASYEGISGGMGKVLSIFNTEYFIFHNGATQIKCVAPNGTVSTLLNFSAEDLSLIVMDNNFLVTTRLSDSITLTSYIIVGSASDFFAKAVASIEIQIPDGYTTAPHLCGCRANNTDIYVAQEQNTTAIGTYKTLKVVTNNTKSPTLSASWVDGALKDMPIPSAQNMLSRVDSTRYFWTNAYKYYVEKNGTSYTIKRSDGTTIWTGVFANGGANFYIDQNTGNGYILHVYTQDVQNQRLVGKLYSLQNGVSTLVVEGAGGNDTSGNFIVRDSVFPLIDDSFAPVLFVSRSTLQDKVVPSASSVTVQTATNTYQMFGSAVRFV